MDYLDWDCSPIVASISSSWSAHQEHHEVAEAFTSESHHSNCGAYNYNGEKYMDLPEDTIFNPTHKLTDFNITADPIISQSHHLNFYSNPEKVLNRMVQHLAPPLDSIIVSPNPNIFSRAETLLSTFPQRPGLCSLKRPHNVMMENTLSGLVAHFGMPLYEENNAFGSVAVSANIESSLNGLIPGTNSYTRTSRVEDDGINSILSSDKSCKNLDSESIFPQANNIEKYQTFDGKFSSGFSLIISNDQPPAPSKKRKIEKPPSSTNISFQQPSNKDSLAGGDCVIDQEPDSEAIAQMKEMIYRAAAFRPVTFGDDVVEKPKRKNVKISSDPQTVAARQRRERISEKIRVLQKLVPGGSKMDTASMLDEAANYLKFLRSQVKALENLGPNLDFGNNNAAASNVNQSAISTSVAPFSIQNSSTFSTS